MGYLENTANPSSVLENGLSMYNMAGWYTYCNTIQISKTWNTCTAYELKSCDAVHVASVYYAGGSECEVTT